MSKVEIKKGFEMKIEKWVELCGCVEEFKKGFEVGKSGDNFPQKYIQNYGCEESWGWKAFYSGWQNGRKVQ